MACPNKYTCGQDSVTTQELCQNDPCEQQAQVSCDMCRANLCPSCFDEIHQHRFMRHHKSKPMNCDRVLSKHPTRGQTPSRRVCATTDPCQLDCAHESMKRESSRVQEQLRTLVGSLQAHVDVCTEMTVRVSQDRTTGQTEIKHFFQHLRNALDEQESLLVTRFTETCREKQTVITQHQQQSLSMQRETRQVLLSLPSQHQISNMYVQETNDWLSKAQAVLDQYKQLCQPVEYAHLLAQTEAEKCAYLLQNAKQDNDRFEDGTLRKKSSCELTTPACHPSKRLATLLLYHLLPKHSAHTALSNLSEYGEIYTSGLQHRLQSCIFTGMKNQEWISQYVKWNWENEWYHQKSTGPNECTHALQDGTTIQLCWTQVPPCMDDDIEYSLSYVVTRDVNPHERQVVYVGADTKCLVYDLEPEQQYTFRLFVRFIARYRGTLFCDDYLAYKTPASVRTLEYHPTFWTRNMSVTTDSTFYAHRTHPSDRACLVGRHVFTPDNTSTVWWKARIHASQTQATKLFVGVASVDSAQEDSHPPTYMYGYELDVSTRTIRFVYKGIALEMAPSLDWQEIGDTFLFCLDNSKRKLMMRIQGKSGCLSLTGLAPDMDWRVYVEFLHKEDGCMLEIHPVKREEKVLIIE